jgi:CRISPR/Cas system-associated exonuclease Cas4 (RecB family)
MARDHALWGIIRRDFEKGISTVKLSEHYKIPRSTLRHHIDTKGWLRPTRLTRDKAYIAAWEKAARGEASHDEMANLASSDGDDGHDALVSTIPEKAEIIRLHKIEWRDVDTLRKLAMKAAKTPGWAPADLTDEEKAKWSSSKRLSFARTVMSLYKSAVEAITAKQEGERRAHGFDYKDHLDKTRNPEDAQREAKYVKEWIENMGKLQRGDVPAPLKGSLH